MRERERSRRIRRSLAGAPRAGGSAHCSGADRPALFSAALNLLILDSGGYALDLAMRAQAAGHRVKWHVDPACGRAVHVGRGMVPRVRDWRRWIRWADLVFLPDNARFLAELEPLRRAGVPIFGANAAGARLELDRAHGQAVLAAHGIATLASHVCASTEEAEGIVRAHPERYVVKPFGDADRSLTYCAHSPADLLYMLRRWRAGRALGGPFMLQRFVAGIEMAVGGWFGPGGWHRRWLENWEFKRLLAGDLGVATGEQGTVLRYVEHSRLAERMLVPLTDHLRAIGYVGYIDLNCIIDADGTPWPLEFTTRPGWPLFNIQQAVHAGDPLAWMRDCVDGRDTLASDTAVALGVVVSIADYPYSHLPAGEVRGIPLYRLPPPSQTHLFQAMRAAAPFLDDGDIVDRDCLVTCGNNVMTVTGTGPAVAAAADAAYRALRELQMPAAPMYRVDIGARLAVELPALQRLGYAEGLAFHPPSASPRAAVIPLRRSRHAAASPTLR